MSSPPLREFLQLLQDSQEIVGRTAHVLDIDRLLECMRVGGAGRHDDGRDAMLVEDIGVTAPASKGWLELSMDWTITC